VIHELEIGAVGTDEADVMVGTRRPRKGQNLEINGNQWKTTTCIEIAYF
jgi:hypothetical protein